ncbi:MAG: hypothetical protein HON27_11120 [Candidatus Marinimicrobia bacterium]|nr:hypothetical protein [Candidatus Neomarinimicrobiota bacterium]MBT4359849.1 hypothetical protein [Candidatus Neomarinimicrobiota bacterium]MBT4420321.1 hypothetical protein [Candidatus Neomarinimicrobiota bacterium]MBT4946709.1 hypothetical protein [Candidatus Neomarinimicrobiota bacterium]MBT6012675.1 hypothetical protein [Candidatus Neomarinimicrobiota bacterium]
MVSSLWTHINQEFTPKPLSSFWGPPLIKLKLIQKKDLIKLEIIDTGIGISEDYKSRIFQPYTQESEGFTKNYQGIGLGLALTEEYLALNNVDLELESEKNVGSTFTLMFPQSEEQK